MKSALGRLKRREEFLRVARAKRKWVAPGLILQALHVDRSGHGGPSDEKSRNGGTAGPETGGHGIRVGYTVSRKVGKSVVRNRVRRRLRAAVAEVMPVHAKAAFDFVVIGRPQTLTRPYPALVRDLKTALSRLGAFRDGPKQKGVAARKAAKEKAKTA